MTRTVTMSAVGSITVTTLQYEIAVANHKHNFTVGWGHILLYFQLFADHQKTKTCVDAVLIYFV